MNETDKHHSGSADHYSDNEDNSSPGTIVIINCVLNGPLMLISILGNALVLAAIIRNSFIRSTSMIMLCSLAVSDLLVGLIAKPFHIHNRFIYYVWIMTGPSVCMVSLLTITTITVDRFVALHYHMRYATLVTKSRVKYTLVIIWLISFLVSGFDFWSIRVNKFLLGVITIICLIICTFSSVIIYLIVRRHQLQMHAQQQAVQSLNAENNLNMTRLKRSAMNTFVFYIALIICYFPLYVVLTLV